jgi:hypothetical protein
VNYFVKNLLVPSKSLTSKQATDLTNNDGKYFYKNCIPKLIKLLYKMLANLLALKYSRIWDSKLEEKFTELTRDYDI